MNADSLDAMESRLDAYQFRVSREGDTLVVKDHKADREKVETVTDKLLPDGCVASLDIEGRSVVVRIREHDMWSDANNADRRLAERGDL